jgi:hypothetical protein
MNSNIKFANELLFRSIIFNCKKVFTPKIIENLKTQNGKTQKSESKYIKIVKNTLNSLNLEYTIAGTQQPFDFRIKTPSGILYLEVKKTDSTTLMLNDTCPNEQIWYLIIINGKQTKKTLRKPQIIGINGSVFLEHTSWNIQEYQKQIEELKIKYKSNRDDCIQVYPRPSYSVKINKFLEN